MDTVRTRDRAGIFGWPRALAVAILAVALCVAFILAATTAAAATRYTDYILGSGDRIRVTVFGQDDLSGEFDVDGGGSVALPLIGDVDLSGMSVRGAESAIAKKLKDGYLKHPRVNVQVLNFRPFYILGEVKRPGSYPFVSGMTVLNAVALAGGYTYRARENDVIIKRNGGKAKAGQRADHNTAVMPGDVIEVRERYF